MKNIVVAAAVLGSLSFTAVDPAAAQTVRRHLHCEIIPTLNTAAIFQINFSTGVQAINNWTFTIPKGTKFTYRVNNRSYTYTSQKALGPGGKMLLGDARGAASCQDVWIPG
ncbi:MAG TPA: hypothetical protein VG757_00750 [Devosia sp.]|nr:hypothetical protein [Devosia sp.]